MLHIKSRAGVRQAVVAGVSVHLATAALCRIEALEEATGGWEPARDGWVALLEAPEELGALGGLGLGTESLLDAPRLAAEHWPDLGCYTVVVARETTYGLALVVPEAILPAAIRAVLNEDARGLVHSRPALTPAG